MNPEQFITSFESGLVTATNTVGKPEQNMRCGVKCMSYNMFDKKIIQ